MQNIITSPIFYQGCKKKNIKEGLIDYFPNNINRFIDLFCGSGIVSMNVDAKSYVLNDIETNLINLLKMFKKENPEKIIKLIEEKINKYELQYDGISFDARSKTFNKKLSDLHKNNYTNFRSNYNINRNILDLYILTIFCFSHQMRFNKDNDFNMPCGNGTFNNDNRKWIKECKEFFNKNILLTNEDFRNIKINKLKEDDFVYLDPPYLISTASYNEGGGQKKTNKIYMIYVID